MIHHPEPVRGVRWQFGVVAAALGVVGGQIVGGVVGAVVALLIIVVGGADAAQIGEGPAWLPVILIGTAALQGTLFVVAWVTPLIVRADLRSALGLRGASWPAYAATALGAIGLAPISNLLMTGLSTLAPDFQLGTLAEMLKLFESQPWWILWPFVGLIPGLCEELFFRGLVQRSLGNRTGGIIAAALAFALMHVDPPHVVGVVPVGLFLGWASYRTGSVWVPVVAHVFNNTLALIASDVPEINVGYGTDTPMPAWWLAVSVITVGACVAVIIWTSRANRIAPPQRSIQAKPREG